MIKQAELFFIWILEFRNITFEQYMPMSKIEQDNLIKLYENNKRNPI